MKEMYEAPTVQVINMELQGVIADSGNGNFTVPPISGEDYK